MVVPLTLGAQAAIGSVTGSGYLALNGKAALTRGDGPSQRCDTNKIEMTTPRIKLDIAAAHVGELHMTHGRQVRD